MPSLRDKAHDGVLCTFSTRTSAMAAVAHFIVLDWGIKSRLWHRVVVPARQAGGWRAGTTTLCHSRLYPPVRKYEFGYMTYQKLAAEQLQTRASGTV